MYLILIYLEHYFYVSQIAKICVFLSEMLLAELYYFMDMQNVKQ